MNKTSFKSRREPSRESATGPEKILHLDGGLISFYQVQKATNGALDARARRVWGSSSGGGLRLDWTECLISFY